jgi:hypothetical protein
VSGTVFSFSSGREFEIMMGRPGSQGARLILPDNNRFERYYTSPKRENARPALCPEEMIMALHWDDSNRDEFLINENPHISGGDTIKLHKDNEHPDGRYSSWEEALSVARQIFERHRERGANREEAQRRRVEATSGNGHEPGR